MTMEAYIQAILSENPNFVNDMNKRVTEEYAEQISETKAVYETRIESARQSWLKNQGDTAYEAHKESIAQHIADSIPRYAYIKHIALGGDVFDVEIDLLHGTWTISPV